MYTKLIAGSGLGDQQSEPLASLFGVLVVMHTNLQCQDKKVVVDLPGPDSTARKLGSPET